MHAYRRTSAKFKLGAAIGASTTTDISGINLHFGPSLLLGDKERICITTGLTLREAKILDRRYKLGVPYEKKVLPESVPLIKKFPLGGFFIALTYNFSQFNGTK